MIVILNAPWPILVTLFGMVTDVNWLDWKAYIPILSTLFPMVNDVNWLLSNALPILITLFGMVNDVIWLYWKQPVPINYFHKVYSH